jgi:hypothetical protein
MLYSPDDVGYKLLMYVLCPFADTDNMNNEDIPGLAYFRLLMMIESDLPSA